MRPLLVAELHEAPGRAQWFGSLGRHVSDVTSVAIHSLAPWRQGTATADEGEAGWIADHMTWLPSTRDGSDPIAPGELEARIRSTGRDLEARRMGLESYKLALPTISVANHPLLRVGPHDFAEAARGAGLYAVRRATLEGVAESPGMWSRLVSLYVAGHWPCGLLPDGRVVVL